MSRFSLSRSRVVSAAALALCLTSAFGFQSTMGQAAIAKGGRSPYQVDQPDPTKAPKVYTIPLRGQLGTDITDSTYKAVIEDVRAKKPDLIVFILDSADVNTREYLQDDDQNEAGMFDAEDTRRLVNNLKEEFKQIPQVMWVKDAVGLSALLAFAWPDIFMSTRARLFGLILIMRQAGHPDWEVHRKFLAAWTAIAGGFFEAGGYDAKTLGEAMMRPEKKLSVSWEGRKLIWRPDETGTYIVDNSDKSVASFNAKTAEDLLLSKGTADDLDDLVFLLGYREWDRSLVDGKNDGVKIIDDYIKRWRDTYSKTREAWANYQREMGWAEGDDAIVHLGKARRALQDILDGMNRYPAVEARWKSRRDGQRLDILTVEGMLRQLKEQIAAAEKAKQRNRPGGGGGLGGGNKGLGGGR